MGELTDHAHHEIQREQYEPLTSPSESADEGIDPTVVVESIRSIGLLPVNPSVNGLITRDRIRLQLPDIPAREQRRAEAVLNRYQQRCGCPTAAVCLLVALILGTIYALDSVETLWSWGFLNAIALVVIGSAMASFVGKLVALFVTRWQFAWACEAIECELGGERREKR